MEILNRLQVLLADAFHNAVGFDWVNVHYKTGNLIAKTAAILAAVFLLKLVLKWRRRKESSFYLHSGFIFSGNVRPGIMYKVIRGSVWSIAAAGVAFLGLALAEPVFYEANRTEQIESREIVYLRDISSSMGFHLSSSSLSRAEAVQTFITKLLSKRRDKRDRSAYVVFATESEIWSSFTTSFESFSFSVFSAPISIAPAEAAQMWPRSFVLKRGKYREQDLGGGTSLHLGLESVIYLFDRKGSSDTTAEMKRNSGIKMRSVVIITDGAADINPEKQFIELKKREIVPYLVFIDPAHEVEKNMYNENSPQAKLPSELLMMVRRYGGEYFSAGDQKSIDKVSETLDRLQSTRKTVKVSANEKEAYYVPLEVAFACFILAVGLRAILGRFWRTI